MRCDVFSEASAAVVFIDFLQRSPDIFLQFAEKLAALIIL